MSLGQYRSGGITLTDAQVAKPQMDTAGNIKTVSGGAGATADQVQGSSASGATDAGNPVKVGGVYNGTLPTLTNGQRGDTQLDTSGNLRVLATGIGTTGADAITNSLAYFVNRSSAATTIPLATAGLGFNGTSWDRVRGDANGLAVQSALSSTFWNYAAAASGIVNTTTAVTIKAAAGASVRNYLKTLTIETDTLGAATELVVRDGSAGTVLWRGKLQTGSQAGRSITFDPPLRGTANTLMEIATLTATVTGGVFVNATGYTGI
jgi:hypothetical protein